MGNDAPRRDLAARVEEQGERIAALSHELEATRHELSSTRENLRTAEEALARQTPTADVAALRGELTAVREDAQRLAQEVVRLRTDAEERAAELASARTGAATGPGMEELRKDLAGAREEISRLHREVAELRITHRAVEAELLALQRASNEMIATQYLDDVLQSTLSGVEEGLGYDLALLMVFDKPGGCFFPRARPDNALVSAARQDHQVVIDRIRIPVSAPGNALGALLESRALSVHATPEPLFAGAEPAEDAERLVRFLGEMGQQAFAAVPMNVRGELAGALVCSRPREAITPRERESLQNFSNQAGMAIENAQLVNDMRRVRDELARKNAELEGTNNRLLEAERTKEALTSMMVHDMKNPLTSIRGYLELLLDEPPERLPDELRKHVRISYESSGRLLDMVRDLLDISKMEEGKLQPASEPIDVKKLIELAHAEQLVLAAKSNKTIELDVRQDLPAIQGDADLVGRVIANLLSNSVKHTPKGAKVTVFAWPAAAHQAAPADAALLVGIRDTGDGIPKEYQEKIFEKFGTVELRKKNAPKLSTGLGLAFCRMAIEAHGGRLWLESEPGQGATFLFALPPTPRRASSPPSRSPAALPPGGGWATPQ